MIEVFTDGGCIGNPGPGGWAFLVRDGSDYHEQSGAEPATTNNRMELRAVIEALTFLIAAGKSKGICLRTDSQYVKNGITQWIVNWKRNGWRTASKDPVKNKELWEQLDALVAKVDVRWEWVKGHAGVEDNERCDTLVGEAIRRLA